MQQKNSDNWALVQAGSRFLSNAESRYAIIELELLAMSWAITKCKLFLVGLPHFTVVTDHHPLIPILNNHRLDKIENPRLQRLKGKFKSKSFNGFSKEWGFQHITSSPRYPQSNGKAEATVKSMKKIIRAAWKRDSLDERTLTRALLQYRNTPSQQDRLSPAQKLFGHPIQDTLPAHRRAFAP